MFFSIIVPVYNVEDYLCECVYSISNQDFEDYEIILVDDGSTDTSGIICDNLAKENPKIHVYHIENKGLSSARNWGIKHSSGVYIFYLDSDDYLEPGGLLQLYTLLSDETDMVIFNYKKIYSDGTQQLAMNYKKLESEYVHDKELLIKILKCNNFSWYSWAFITKRELIIKNGLYFTPGILYEDVDISFRYMLASHKIKVTNFPIINYRYKRPNAITSKITKSTELNKLSVITKNIKWIASNLTDYKLRRALCNKFSQGYFNIMIMYYRLPQSERKTVLNALQDELWVCKYVRTFKYRFIYLLIQMIGLESVCWLLYCRSKIRERIKKYEI